MLSNWATNLTSSQLSTLLALYPPSAFEEDARIWNEARNSDDVVLSAYYFRAARILRDMLFTCPTLYYGLQCVKHSSSESFRIYDLNQSMLNPVFAMAGMPYAGAMHGSDIPYLYGNLQPGWDASPPQRRLSNQYVNSVISFVTSGDPVARQAESPTFHDWPVAFSSSDNIDEDLVLSQYTALVIGGPLGTGPADVTPYASHSLRPSTAANEPEMPLTSTPQRPVMGNKIPGIGDFRSVMNSVLRYSTMASREESSVAARRTALLEKENLFQRCRFINSLAESLGNKLGHPILTACYVEAFICSTLYLLSGIVSPGGSLAFVHYGLVLGRSHGFSLK